MIKKTPELPNKKVNVVKAIYSNYFNPPSKDGSLDPSKITAWNKRDQAYKKNFTEGIKVLLPEGMRHPLSLDTNTDARFCIGNSHFKKMNEYVNCTQDYKVKIRAMLSKIPGLMFTGFQSASLISKVIVTEDQYKQMLNDFLSNNPNATSEYNKLIHNYKFSNDIPKNKLFVKLTPEITDERR